MNWPNSQLSSPPRVSISNYLPEAGDAALVRQILTGLCAKQKYIASMFFYDETGSKLFETITGLPEYYLTRTEKTLLKEASEQFCSLFGDLDIIEIGSGDCSKISLLLDAMPPDARADLRYIPLDVSESAIIKSVETLRMLYPEITIRGVVADFLSQLNLIPHGHRRLFCFFGSTIGNLSSSEAQQFIRNISQIMQSGDHLLLGLDRVKEVRILQAAYNDRQQVTAAFNRNILNVVNAHTGSNFDPKLFDHLAFYNSDRSRIEMHLKARCNMVVHCPRLKENLHLFRGETIHTENSRKFTEDDIAALSRSSGLNILNQWTDPKQWFTLIQLGKA